MTSYEIKDLYCCAGLGADGYAAVFGAQALHGYDIADVSEHYPYRFTQADALELLKDPLGELFDADALHTSPPCQEFTTAGHLRKAQGGKSRFGDLLTPTLALLRTRTAGNGQLPESPLGSTQRRISARLHLVGRCRHAPSPFAVALYPYPKPR